MKNSLTPAHEASVVVTFVERYQAHEPRESDPHYKYFHQAHDRLKKAGLLKCNVNSEQHYGQIELHHDKVEYAHINDVDLDKFNVLYGLHLDDEGFKQYVEGVSGLEPLCIEHHRGTLGIHSLPGPEWGVMRVAKAGTPIFQAQSNSLIPIVKEKI